MIGTRVRSPSQSRRPPFGPVATRVIFAPSSGRVLRLCSSKPSGSKLKSTGSLGRRSWKCRLPSASWMRSMRSGNGSLGCSGSGDSLGGILNRLARLSWPFSSNSSSVCGPSSSTSARCSWRFHRLSSCRLAYSRRKASWGVLLLAQAQTPEGQFQAEGVEFDTFETCGDGGVLRQLLVGDAQPDAGYEQKAQQAIDEEGDQQGADSAFQSFGHGSLSFSVLSGALEYGTASRFRP